jgi:hypothetical protein
MDAPSLKAFVSPRSHSRRQQSNNSATKHPIKCHSSKLLQFMDKNSLHLYIKELQTNMKQECNRTQSKSKPSDERVGSQSKENVNPYQSLAYKSC